MKNKSILIYKKENGETMCKYLLLSAFVHGDISPERRSEFRLMVRNRMIADSTMTFSARNRLGSGIMIFDFYTIERLGFFQRLHHVFRVVKATIFDYIGISSAVVIVE